MFAWESGLKTTYYLRGKSATKIEKSTVEERIKETQEDEEEEHKEELETCSILNPDCESCQ
jgi:ribonucleoside-diphosphate reductase alpha chain